MLAEATHCCFVPLLRASMERLVEVPMRKEDEKQFSDAALEEAEYLIELLRWWGVCYLMSEPHSIAKEDLGTDVDSARRLIVRLACCPYPRVRDASIALFLLHPELVPAIFTAMEEGSELVAEQIATLTLASLYLQRFWSIRLLLAFGHPSSLPEAPFAWLWHTRNLPSPSLDFGAWGLRALQAFEQQRTGQPFNYSEDWQNQVRHLLVQEEQQQRQYLGPLNLAQMLPPASEQEQENAFMSMRPRVNKQKIDQFLRDVGRGYQRGPVIRLYLVGGAELVHAGIRAGDTQDIDLEISDGNLASVIRQVGQRLNVNVEFAAPGDFLPLPSQWEVMSQYVGRYGQVDVFYFDFYSLALSKIERGSSRDITDVELLVRQGVVTLPELDSAFGEVVAKMGQGAYFKLDPTTFTQKYQRVRQTL